MDWWLWVVVGVLVLGTALYLSMTAGRLDRLHRRIDTARLALDNQLLRRSTVCLEVAASGLFDPVSSALLAEATHAARAEEEYGRARELAESDLSRTLRALLEGVEFRHGWVSNEVGPVESPADDRGDVGGGSMIDDLDSGERALLAELAASCRRVELARRFLNDGVRACRQVRKQRMVRWFRLAGHTPWPQTVELDDTPPPALIGI
jgi:hypothetical protein